MKKPVSVLLLTLNEEKNLPRCLSSLGWCDDIVAIDSLSEDNTVELLRENGVRVFQRSFDNFAGQRNYALEKIEFQHEWIFHLDADEVLLPELIDEINETLHATNFDAFLVPSKTIFMGKWLQHAGMYPTYQVRLTRADSFRFRQEGHGQKEDIHFERIGVLKTPYLHYSFSKGIEDWIAKHNRYSTQEAGLIVHLKTKPFLLTDLLTSDKYCRRRALKQVAARLPFRPLCRFIYMFFLRLGVLDGYPGFIYCCLLAYYEFLISLKAKEIIYTKKSVG